MLAIRDAIKNRCTGCMDSQGDRCKCRPRHRSWSINATEFWRLALAAVAIGYGAVAFMLWLAHIRSTL